MFYVCNEEGVQGSLRNLTVQLTLTIFFENICEFLKILENTKIDNINIKSSVIGREFTILIRGELTLSEKIVIGVGKVRLIIT